MTIDSVAKNPTTALPPSEVVYPDSDGKPMGETGIHVKTILHLYGALMGFYTRQRQNDVYVAANMFLYYQEGNSRAVKTPDVMVIRGVDGNQIRERRSFMTWREGAVPSVIFEITSKSTWMEDLVTKSSLYASLGVQEYFIFDLLEEYLEQTLQGFELQDREFIPKELVEPGVFYCEQLHLNVQREDILLRLSVPETGEKLLSTDEAIVKAYQEQARAEQEVQRAEAAEAEIARLRAQLAAIQKNDKS